MPRSCPAAAASLQKDMELTLDPTRSTTAATCSTGLDRIRRDLEARGEISRHRRLSAAGVPDDSRRRGEGVRSVAGRPQDDRPLRHGPARRAPTRSAASGTTTTLRRQRQDARQAAAAGPPAVRGGLRLRDGDDELRLGHARRREQRRRWRGHAVHGPAARSRRVGVHRRLRSPRPVGQDPARRLRRNGPHAADQRATAAATTGATSRRSCSPAAA